MAFRTFNEFYDWWTDTVKGKMLTDEQFENCKNRFFEKGIITNVDVSSFEKGTKLYINQKKRGELTSVPFGLPVCKVLGINRVKIINYEIKS